MTSDTLQPRDIKPYVSRDTDGNHFLLVAVTVNGEKHDLRFPIGHSYALRLIQDLAKALEV